MSFIEAPIFIGKNQKIKNMQFVFQTFQNQCDYFLFFGHRLVAHRRLTKKFKKKALFTFIKKWITLLVCVTRVWKTFDFSKKM